MCFVGLYLQAPLGSVLQCVPLEGLVDMQRITCQRAAHMDASGCSLRFPTYVLQLLLCFTVQVEAATPLTVLALARDTFLSVLGPLEELMKREKSPQVGGMY